MQSLPGASASFACVRRGRPGREEETKGVASEGHPGVGVECGARQLNRGRAEKHLVLRLQWSNYTGLISLQELGWTCVLERTLSISFVPFPLGARGRVLEFLLLNDSSVHVTASQHKRQFFFFRSAQASENFALQRSRVRHSEPV